MIIQHHLPTPIPPERLLSGSAVSQALSQLQSGSDAQKAREQLSLSQTQWAAQTGAANADPDADAEGIQDSTRRAIGQSNLGAAASILEDPSAAAAAVQSARDQIVAQPGAALQAQANTTPESAWGLLS